MGVDHIDTDALVVEREGRSIADIFATDGEVRIPRSWRPKRSPTRSHVARSCHLGGGAAATDAVRDLLVGHTVVYIDAPHDELVRRTASKTHRPLLATGPRRDAATPAEVEREPHYRAVATIVVESGPGPVDDVVTAIAQQLEHA